MLYLEPRVSVRKAALFVLGWTFIFSGLSWSVWGLHQYLVQKWRNDPQYSLITLIQETPTAPELHQFYIEELLGLSQNNPPNAYLYDVEKARRLLLASPVITNAEVAVRHGRDLLVRYQARRPIAYVGEFTALALDDEGVLFPNEPLYTPKRLPKVFLGIPEEKEAVSLWEQTVDTAPLALVVVKQLHTIIGNDTAVLVVDVSRAFAPSNGRREVVVTLQEPWGTSTLRLDTSSTEQGLTEYLVLRNHLVKQSLEKKVAWPSLVDLRAPGLAFYTPQ